MLSRSSLFSDSSCSKQGCIFLSHTRMPPQAESPRKPTRRSRRPPKKSAASITSQIPPTQDAELSTEASPDRQSDKPKRILRRGEQDVAIEESAPLNLQPLPPHTPPRPRSMYEGSLSKQLSCNDSASEISQSMKRTPKNQGQKQPGPMPVSNGTPGSTARTQSLTPSRTNDISARAYAGPTFHASPAASSLPVPRFFSKSVPNVDKTTSLKAMMRQEAPETTSESEGSLHQENKEPAQGHSTREESPLEVFFRADREAKARNSSPAKNMDIGNNQAEPNASPSKSPTSPRHHSRQPTDSSASGMFPMEMDGARVGTSSSPALQARSSSNLASNRPHVYSSMTEAERKDEQRKAQTAALKQLIHSPQPQTPHNGSTGQRPASSGLRKEVMLPTSPEQVSVAGYPGTPTPSRVHKPYTRADARAQSHQNGCTSPYTPFTSSKLPFQGSRSTLTRNNGNTKSMEDDLRRILKLDVLGEGVTPIRS